LRGEKKYMGTLVQSRAAREVSTDWGKGETQITYKSSQTVGPGSKEEVRGLAATGHDGKREGQGAQAGKRAGLRETHSRHEHENR